MSWGDKSLIISSNYLLLLSLLFYILWRATEKKSPLNIKDIKFILTHAWDDALKVHFKLQRNWVIVTVGVT